MLVAALHMNPYVALAQDTAPHYDPLVPRIVTIKSSLETPGYQVTIVTRCEEPSLLCDDVTYTGVSKKTRRSITIRGSKAVRYCSDGQTPCQDLGYKFPAGNVLYAVTPEGRLSVTNVMSGKVLVDEQGKWIIE